MPAGLRTSLRHPFLALRRRRRIRDWRQEVARWNSQHDPVENRATAPPPDETIRFTDLWLVEFYSPSTVGLLLKSMRLQPLDVPIPQTEPADLIREWRRGMSGGWRLLGSFSHANTSTKEALPQGIRGATLLIQSASPSVTALLGHFTVDEQLGARIQHVLETDRATLIEPRGRAQHLIDPQAQKQTAAHDAIRMTADECFRWMTRKRPGFFSGVTSKVPAWALLAFGQGHPFDDDSTGYMRTLGVNASFGAWILSDDVRFGPASTNRMDRTLLILGRHGTGNDEEFGNRLSLSLQSLIVASAATEMLAAMRASIADIRDSLGQAKRQSTRVAVARLRSARNQLLTIAADAQQVSSHFHLWAKNQDRFLHGMPRVRPAKQELWDVNDYSELVRQVLSERSSLLTNEESQTRNVIVAVSSLETSSVNLRLQRAVTWLTWVLVVMGAATIALAVWAALRVGA